MNRTLSLLLLLALCLCPLAACQEPEDPSTPQDDIEIVGGEFDYADSDLSTYLDLPESIFADFSIRVNGIPEITDATVLAEFNSHFTKGGYYAPKENDDTVDMGDLLYIHDTGAHGFAMGYNYNGKLRSAEVLLHEDGTFDMIRRAETPKDYFATFSNLSIYDKLIDEAGWKE